ncbi:MAG: hypothetical protein LBS31_07950, partial [Candidatus Adiutrix sp.]|nr:hypothetical protein [Candidatus Adiutrix sp.]
LASAKDGTEIAALVEEMRDRFGALPAETVNLVGLMEVKILLKQARVRRLESGPGGLTLTFGPEGPASYDKVMALVTAPGRKVRLSPSGRLFVGDINLKTAADLERIKKFLPGLI